MLLLSKTSSAPRSLASSAAMARLSRCSRSLPKSTRSSKSTLMRPGAGASGRDGTAIGSPMVSGLRQLSAGSWRLARVRLLDSAQVLEHLAGLRARDLGCRASRARRRLAAPGWPGVAAGIRRHVRLTGVFGLGSVLGLAGAIGLGGGRRLTGVFGLGSVLGLAGAIGLGGGRRLTGVIGLGSVLGLTGAIGLGGGRRLTGVLGLTGVIGLGGGRLGSGLRRGSRAALGRALLGEQGLQPGAGQPPELPVRTLAVQHGHLQLAGRDLRPLAIGLAG